MKRIMFFTALLVLTFSHCQTQNIEKDKKQSGNNIPEEKVIVNKEYDDNGNLIRYDSTYTYFYSNILNDTLSGDSIFNHFRSHFNNNFMFSEDPFFDKLFFPDSLTPFDFYKRDFFRNRFESNWDRFDNLFWQMDSLKDNFFLEEFRQDSLFKLKKK